MVSEAVDEIAQPVLPSGANPHCCRLYDARAESSDTHMEVADSMKNALGTQPGLPDPPTRNPEREVAVVAPVGRVAPSCTTAEYEVGVVLVASADESRAYNFAVPVSSELTCSACTSTAPGLPDNPVPLTGIVVAAPPSATYRTLLVVLEAPAR